MEHLLTSESIISFIVLVILEIVLGIDNVIFVSIIMNRLPESLRTKSRWTWMFSGIIMRSILLLGLGWLLKQKGKSLFELFGRGFDLASLVMIAGGLFLIYKTVMEIHHKLEGEEATNMSGNNKSLSFSKAIFQIILIDMVFSFDSIITAGGTAKHIEIMIAAVVIAMIVMFLFSAAIASFVHKHPTIKMLALSFLVMIGLVLLVEGFDSEKAHDLHLKNYVYFAMAFSFLVEMLNMKARKNSNPVELREKVLKENIEDKLAN
ncbi:MAG: TerC family protein [Chitinophagaceae bacterium]|nr:TerC family protein [Chitinophagaceae bacterium]